MIWLVLWMLFWLVVDVISLAQFAKKKRLNSVAAGAVIVAMNLVVTFKGLDGLNVLKAVFN